MKAEHRKELQTNVLAERLSHVMQAVKEGPSRGTVLVVTAIVLIVGLGYTWRYLSHSSERSESERWIKWDNDATPAKLKELLDDKELEGTIQGRLVRFQMARKDLFEGTRDLGQEGSEHDRAVKKVQNAAELYGRLSSEVADRPILVQEALWGAAKANETVGQLDKARELYSRLVREYPDSHLARDARQQLERLDNPANKSDLEEIQRRFNTAAGGS